MGKVKTNLKFKLEGAILKGGMVTFSNILFNHSSFLVTFVQRVYKLFISEYLKMLLERYGKWTKLEP